MKATTRKFLDLLTEAGLKGHPQIVGKYHSRKGDCAVGLWYQTHKVKDVGLLNEMLTTRLVCLERRHCGGGTVISAAVCLNDCYKLDFLGIARKLESLLEPEP